jgi:hypothetical protein
MLLDLLNKDASFERLWCMQALAAKSIIPLSLFLQIVGRQGGMEMVQSRSSTFLPAVHLAPSSAARVVYDRGLSFFSRNSA